MLYPAVGVSNEVNNNICTDGAFIMEPLLYIQRCVQTFNAVSVYIMA